MSALVRMALRLAAIELLNTDPVISAVAGGRIYDSEMSEIHFADDPVPVIIVHTEKTQGAAYSANNGGPPFDIDCEIAFEIANVASAKNDDGSFDIFRPVTNAEMEAGIDLIESRIPEVLALSESALGIGFRKHVLKRMTGFESDRFETDDAGIRIASRLLKIGCQIHIEQPQAYYGTIPAVPGPGIAPAPGSDALPSGFFANLPEPLRSIAPLMGPEGYGAKILEMIAAKLPAAGHDPAFLGALIGQDFGPDGLA